MKIIKSICFVLFTFILFSYTSFGQSITLSPSSGDPGDSFTVTISGTGTNFSVSSTTTAKIENGTDSYTISGAAADATTFNGTLDIPANASTGDYDATIYQDGESGTFWSCTGCFTINQACNLSLAVLFEDVSCAGDSTGSVSLTVDGATNPTFAWSNGETTEDLAGVPAGTYTVTVTDGECVEEISATISQPSPLDVSITATPLSTMDTTDGKISTSVIGGSPPYTYAWSNGETTDSIVGLAAGTYTVTVTDMNGCSLEVSSTISTFNCSLEASISGTNVTCNGANDGTAILNIAGGDPSYMVTWTDGIAGILERTGLAAGAYFVTVRDQVGCELTDSITITEPDSINISTIQLDNLCSAETNGSIAITEISGNQGPASIAWSNGSSDSMIVGLSAGDFTVSVSDTLGCVATQSFTLTDPDPVTVSLDSIVINGDSTWSIFITPSGGSGVYLAEWSDTAAIVSLELNPTVSNSGFYYLSISDDNGCTTSIDTLFIEALTTSIIDIKFDAETKIWPTLVQNNIQIELPESNAVFKLHIFNNAGIMLEKFNLNSGLSTKFLNNYSPGVYYMGISGKEGFTMKKFIIK